MASNIFPLDKDNEGTYLGNFISTCPSWALARTLMTSLEYQWSYNIFLGSLNWKKNKVFLPSFPLGSFHVLCMRVYSYAAPNLADISVAFVDLLETFFSSHGDGSSPKLLISLWRTAQRVGSS